MDACTLVCLLGILHGTWTLPLYSRHGGGASFARHRDSSRPHLSGRPADMELGADYQEPSPDRAAEALQHQGPQCIHMSLPWASSEHRLLSHESSSPFRVQVHTSASGPTRPLFPHQHLFHYIKRIYSCCKQGFACRKIKGLQGRVVVDGPLRNLEFYVDSHTLDLPVQRAELHLEISNPDHLMVVPVLKVPGFSSSSHTTVMRDDVSDLTLDVMFLFDMLREDQAMMTEEGAELILNLHCIQDNLLVPCDYHGVSILRAPFIALLYK